MYIYKEANQVTMSTIELKERLISKIPHPDNPEILGEVFRALEIDNYEIEVVKLSDQQKQAIMKGQEDIKNRRFLINEQAGKETEEWLNQ